MTSLRGWCPSLHEPMATGDGLLVRVKPPLGRLSAIAARRLAMAAAAYGNGAIELTGRGALQFRGLTDDSAGRFASVSVELGLAVADVAAERRRSVLVSPFAGAAATGLALALEAAIVDDAGLAGLPAKFGFAVEGDGGLPLGSGADITVAVHAEGCVIVPDGAEQGIWVEVTEAVSTVLRMTHAFLALAGGQRRMRAVAAAEIFAACGRQAVAFRLPETVSAVGPLGGGFGAGVPFGSLDAAMLVALAGLGDMQLTPWRAILFADSSDPAPLRALGLIVDPADPRLSISACPGRPGCASASVETREIAAALRPAPGIKVHVSGCSKGCAHPGPAAITFVGRDGRFDLVRGGRASDMPHRRGLSPAELLQVR